MLIFLYKNTTLLSKINDEIFQEYNFLFHSDICDVHNQVKDKEEDEIRIDCEKFKESWKIEVTNPTPTNPFLTFLDLFTGAGILSGQDRRFIPESKLH